MSILNIAYQTINENFGLPTDTEEILRCDTVEIKRDGPLREIPVSSIHFYNRNLWEMRVGGDKGRWQQGTFTIYESDKGKIEK